MQHMGCEPDRASYNIMVDAYGRAGLVEGKNCHLSTWNFCLRIKIDIEAWVDISTSMNENTKTKSKNYKILYQIDNKSVFYSTIYQEIGGSHKKKNFLIVYLKRG